MSGDAGLAIVLAEDPGTRCAGTASDCGSLPATEPTLEVPPSRSCDLLGPRGRVEMQWIHEIDIAACPLPPCWLASPESAVDEEGNLLVGAWLHRDSSGGHFGVGRLTIRYTPDGDLLSSELEGFNVAHLGASPDRAPRALGMLDGRMIWVQHDEAETRDGRVRVGLRDDAEGALVPLIERVSTNAQLLLQPGQGTLAVRFAVAATTAEYADGTDFLIHARPGIARYAADGSLLYSRSDWAEDDATIIDGMRSDESGMIYLSWFGVSGPEYAPRLTAFAPDGEPLWTRALPERYAIVGAGDASVYLVTYTGGIGSQAATLVQVDRAGDVSWAIDLPPNSSQDISPDGAGGLLIDSEPWADPAERVLLRIDPRGTCTVHDSDIPRVRITENGDSFGGNVFFTALERDDFIFVGEGTRFVGRARIEGPP